MSDLVSVERRGHVSVIGVHRPEKRNAWNVEIIRTVAEACTDLHADPDLRVGVIHGEGEHFTAGLDLMDVLPALSTGEPADLLPDGLCDPWDFLGEPCSKPIVMAVQGSCFTLGIELILATQYTVAATDTVFAQAEVMRGIVPLGGAQFRLPRLGAAGLDWLLTGRRFTADEAVAAGMVNELVAPGEQLERALEIAEQIAANAPRAVQGTLAMARAAERPARDAAAAVLRDLVDLLTSEDAIEGMNAMIERRPPHFTGR